MSEQELYRKIKPILEGYTEGVYWDFKKTLSGEGDIIRDILAFSNSAYEGDSYIIVGVSEPKTSQGVNMIALSSDDRRRLNTSDNFLYIPSKFDIHGLFADDIQKMKDFSETLTQKIFSNMLISMPVCEFMPVQIGKTRWLYVIVVKKVPGVFAVKEDMSRSGNKKDKDVYIKQGVLYIRVADTTFGAQTTVASSTEYIRIWKRYIDWLSTNSDKVPLLQSSI